MLHLLLASLNVLQVALLYLLYKSQGGERRAMERERQAHNQMMREVMDRVMHFEGRTWTPPPLTEEEKERARREQEERDEANKRALEGWSEL